MSLRRALRSCHATSRPHVLAAVTWLWLAASALGQGQPTDWVRARVLEQRLGHAVVWDAARERLMLFGGDRVADTWEWDGICWTRRSPVTRPPARVGQAMAYDSGRRRVVMFGGRAIDGVPIADTWEWDGSDWTQRLPATSPPAGTGHAMGYDSVRQRVVMVGGTSFRQAWEWDGANWTQFAGLGPYPSDRSGHALAYDTQRRRFVLFGGADGSGMLADTWEWAGGWSQRSPTLAPPARADHAMAYDPARQRVVLFGGVDDQVWEWDGTRWTHPTPATSPSARSGHAMGYDMVRQRVVLSGGIDGGDSERSDTWEWDGANWNQRAPNLGPTRRSGAALAFDGIRQRTLLFGGLQESPDSTSAGDTWEWDGASWTQQAPATSPGARDGHAMAWDAARQRAVLFGGQVSSGQIGAFCCYADTWEWTGSNWIRAVPTASPPGRAGHAMAYDAMRQRVVLFGARRTPAGGPLADTWEWDGANWIQRTPALSPSPRGGHAMTYDGVRQRIVLFGGGYSTNFSDTWEWDGATWTLRAPASSPAARSGHALAYDGVRQRVVLHGGRGGPNLVFADTWEWDGTNWTQRTPATSAGAVAGPAMAWDAIRQRIVMVGETGTWLYGPLTPATTQTIGAACPGSNGLPVLSSGEPYLGNPGFSLELLSARPSSVCAFFLADRQQSRDLGGGCTAYVDGAIVMVPALSNTFGFATTRLAVPLNIALRGAQLFAQAMVVDPLGPVGGLAFSAGRSLVIGD